MLLFAIFSFLSFAVGCFVGWLLLGKLGPKFNGFDVVKLGVWMIFSALLIVGTGYFLSATTGNTLIYYIGLFVAGIVFLLPLLLLINIYLLWWNPEKYKEYEMKKRRRQKQLDLEKELETND